MKIGQVNIGLLSSINSNRANKYINNKYISRDTFSFGSSESDIEMPTKQEIFDFFILAGELPKVILGKKIVFDKMSISQFTNRYTYDLPGTKKVASLLESKGIVSLSQLISISRIFRERHVNVAFYEGEDTFIDVYSNLKTKSHLNSYPNLLYHVYKEENSKSNPDFTKLDKYSDFLFKIGIDKEEKIEGVFSWIKSNFNDLQTQSDVVDLIEYSIETYPKKLELLSPLLSKNKQIASISPEVAYTKIGDLIDMFFIQNNGSSLHPLEEFIVPAVQIDLLKDNNVKAVASSFNQFDSPSDITDFLITLSHNGLSVRDFNTFNPKSVIADIDFMKYIKNKETLVPVISQVCKLSINDSKTFYLKYHDLLNSVYKDDSSDFSSVQALCSVINNFDIKDSVSFLSFYNRINKSQEKKLSSQNVQEFVDLVRFSSKDDLKNVKKKNLSELQLLNLNKDIFYSCKENIEKFISSDETNFFAGMSAFDIFTKYKNSIIENISDVTRVLQNIVDLGISTSDEYQDKIGQIRRFSAFFPDRKSLFSFIQDNEISFNKNKDSKAYIENCLKVFSSIYDENNVSYSQKLIQQLSQSKFLLKSKSSLTEFISSCNENDSLKKYFNFFINRNVSSIEDFYSFYNLFKSANSTQDSLLQYLETLPYDIKFKDYVNSINQLNSSIKNLNLPIKIDFDNLSNLSSQDLFNLSSNSLSKIINKLSTGNENKNFLINLLQKNDSNSKTYSRYKISYELVKNLNSDDNCYSKFLQSLKLDSDYLFQHKEYSEKQHIEEISKFLPSEIYSLINSDDWQKVSFNDKEYTVPLTLHSKLRAISRFMLNSFSSFENFDFNHSKDKMLDLFSKIYLSTPDLILPGANKNTFKCVYKNADSSDLHVVFNKLGTICTLYER